MALKCYAISHQSAAQRMRPYAGMSSIPVPFRRISFRCGMLLTHTYTPTHMHTPIPMPSGALWCEPLSMNRSVYEVSLVIVHLEFCQFLDCRMVPFIEFKYKLLRLSGRSRYSRASARLYHHVDIPSEG